jgi:hypothetical protein
MTGVERPSSVYVRLYVDVAILTDRPEFAEKGVRYHSFGPFSRRVAVEDCLTVLAGRSDVVEAHIREVTP